MYFENVKWIFLLESLRKLHRLMLGKRNKACEFLILKERKGFVQTPDKVSIMSDCRCKITYIMSSVDYCRQGWKVCMPGSR